MTTLSANPAAYSVPAIGDALYAGGSVLNPASTSIIGAYEGVEITGGAGAVVNNGVIAGIAGVSNGVFLGLGGSVTNSVGASVTGDFSGIQITGAAGTVLNQGSVVGTGTASEGVYLAAGGQVTNSASGSITGVFNGVQITGDGTVLNAGDIGGTRSSGVRLISGGTITNASGGVITGGDGGVIAGGVSGALPGVIVNDGAITGTYADASGLFFHSGGTVTNEAQGTVAGAFYGIDVVGGAGAVVNAGSIAGTGFGSRGRGVEMNAGGSLDNAASGSITGHADGVGMTGASGTVFNAGDISGATGYGVTLLAGGAITNAAGASMTGAGDGIGISGGAGTVLNSGLVVGTSFYGVHLASGGVITNTASASITGGLYGVSLPAGGTLTNAGTITGGGRAVAFGGNGNNLLVLQPGFAFSGQVTGSPSAINTLELASAASAGTVTGLGALFTNFGPIVFDPGAHWTIDGTAPALSGPIIGLASGDTIEVDGVTATGSSYAGGVLTLFGPSGAVTLNVGGGFTSGEFEVSNAAAGAAVGVAAIIVACFRAGTRILTARGQAAVEALCVGDMLPAHDGEGRMTLRPVVWLGHRTIDCRRHPRPRDVWPVRVAADAFGPGMPLHDLWLSPDHAVFVDGVLVPVRHLVNGTTILQERHATVTYWHVELAQHGVVIAEGLPCESYLDTGNRTAVTDSGDTVQLHPDFGAHRREARACARLVVAGDEMIALRQRLHREQARRRVSRGGPIAVATRMTPAVAG